MVLPGTVSWYSIDSCDALFTMSPSSSSSVSVDESIRSLIPPTCSRNVENLAGASSNVAKTRKLHLRVTSLSSFREGHAPENTL
ncbi:hypothetical protein BAQU_0435 [Bifidobacterium aquikefiri]|uniref:Uncharacterized protein n=1 Tax=Bifidobacterium aquikefiri TaxID=1653207 RepID=A0A261G8N2_9BIFI|nr:hypothetical protein BAQU_0435 [Bifidobacterium aquikefiri]